MNENLWKTDDPDWMAQREKEWVHIKANLDKMHPTIPKRSQRYHKKLFFEGILDPILSDVTAMMRENIEWPFDGYLPLFKMWYLPEANLEAFKNIFESVDDIRVLGTSRSMLFEVFGHNLFSTNYGLFGGREELLVKTFILGYDYQELIKVGRKKYYYNYDPSSILTYCAAHTSGLLASGIMNPYAPGQYLWDNLDYSLDKYPEEAFKEGYEEKLLRTCLRRILDWDERLDAPKELAHSVSLRKNLLERFETNDFLPALMKLWHEEKQAYENGEPYPE